MTTLLAELALLRTHRADHIHAMLRVRGLLGLTNDDATTPDEVAEFAVGELARTLGLANEVRLCVPAGEPGAADTLASLWSVAVARLLIASGNEPQPEAETP